VFVGAVLSNQTALFLPRDWAVRFKLLVPLLVPTLMGEGAILMLFTSWGLLNTSTLAAESRTIKSLYLLLLLSVGCSWIWHPLNWVMEMEDQTLSVGSGSSASWSVCWIVMCCCSLLSLFFLSFSVCSS
jgi:hypothetical protein